MPKYTAKEVVEMSDVSRKKFLDEQTQNYIKHIDEQIEEKILESKGVPGMLVRNIPFDVLWRVQKEYINAGYAVEEKKPHSGNGMNLMIWWDNYIRPTVKSPVDNPTIP
jgi:hypothetical protein